MTDILSETDKNPHKHVEQIILLYMCKHSFIREPFKLHVCKTLRSFN